MLRGQPGSGLVFRGHLTSGSGKGGGGADLPSPRPPSHDATNLVPSHPQVYFLLVVALFTALWYLHYKEFYPPLNQVAGMLGRMNVYLIALTGFLGTRRVTWSWWLMRLSYEKALRAHYYVGIVASVYTLTHGIVYLVEFAAQLPENSASSGLMLLASIGLLFPSSAFTAIRVHMYWLFRYIHFLGPIILVLSVCHALSRIATAVDGTFQRRRMGRAIEGHSLCRVVSVLLSERVPCC